MPLSRKVGITEQTYYRWRREYGGMRIEQAKRLKELEKENTQLKKLVADLSLGGLQKPIIKDDHVRLRILLAVERTHEPFVCRHYGRILRKHVAGNWGLFQPPHKHV